MSNWRDIPNLDPLDLVDFLAQFNLVLLVCDVILLYAQNCYTDDVW